MQRFNRDLINGNMARMAREHGLLEPSYLVKTIEQPIRTVNSSAGKLINIRLGASQLNHLIIGSGQLFSFWKILGDPSAKKGYRKSRTIKGDELKEETGGGLCQLSGLVYYLALYGGLTITERHPHSLDIYREEERFTPLGSDATVVYGYKDLRFINPYPFPVSFAFEVTEVKLTGILSSGEKVEPLSIAFEYEKNERNTQVTTVSRQNENISVIDRSTYRLYTV